MLNAAKQMQTFHLNYKKTTNWPRSLQTLCNYIHPLDISGIIEETLIGKIRNKITFIGRCF